MPQIITISNSKGGVGKSTIALNLYYYFQNLGAKVGLADLDYQQSITSLGRGNIELVNLDFVDKSFKIVLVDTPPYRSEQTSNLLSMSSFLLIPVKPSVFDLEAVKTMLQDAKKSNVNYGVLLNMVKPGTPFPNQVRQTLETWGEPVLKCEIRDRITYARSLLYEDGIKHEGNEKAHNEISSLANEILTKLI